MRTIEMDNATSDYPVIVNYFKKKGVEIEIDGYHPTGEDCIFNLKTKAWLGYTSMFCYEHECMECEVCE